MKQVMEWQCIASDNRVVNFGEKHAHLKTARSKSTLRKYQLWTNCYIHVLCNFDPKVKGANFDPICRMEAIMVTSYAELEKGASFLPCSVNHWCIYDNDSSSSDIKLWLMGYNTRGINIEHKNSYSWY